MDLLNYKIYPVPKDQTAPYDLLLLADETKEAIDKYIKTSKVFVLKDKLRGDTIAAFVLYPVTKEDLEIKNIAVSENMQDKGIGSLLIKSIQKIAKNAGYKTLWVGTPDIAEKELYFYRKNGFEDAYIKENFFLENYTEPIYNDGVLLKDMAMLKMNL